MAAEMYAGAEWDPENPRMHIGTQRFSTSDEHLEFLARCGVTNMAINDAREITPDPSRGWTVEEIVEKKEKAAKTRDYRGDGGLAGATSECRWQFCARVYARE